MSLHKIYGNAVIATPKAEEKTVNLDMSEGDQVVVADSGKAMFKLIAKKPWQLIPAYIRKGVTIGGVTGKQTVWTLSEKEISVTENGVIEVTPPAGDNALSKVTLIVNVSGGYTVYFADGVWIADTVTVSVEYADGSTETLNSQNDMGGKICSNVVKMTFTDTDSERYVIYKMPTDGGSEESLYLTPTATLVLTANANIMEIGK